MLLRQRLRRDLLAAVAPDDGVEDLAHVLACLERAEHGVDGVRRRSGGRPRRGRRARRSPRAPRRPGVVALERQLIAAQANVQPRRSLRASSTPSRDPGQLGGDRVRDVEGLLHRSSVGSGVARKWWTLVAVCTATFMLLLDITIVNVALPAIQRALDASFSDLQWVGGRLRAGLATCVLTAGALADLFGRKRLFLIGVVALHDRLGVLRPFERSALPDHRARRAGHRRRDHVRDRARAALAGVPRAGARDGVRRVGRDGRARGRDRPARRRRC